MELLMKNKITLTNLFLSQTSELIFLTADHFIKFPSLSPSIITKLKKLLLDYEAIKEQHKKQLSCIQSFDFDLASTHHLSASLLRDSAIYKLHDLAKDYKAILIYYELGLLSTQRNNMLLAKKYYQEVLQYPSSYNAYLQGRAASNLAMIFIDEADSFADDAQEHINLLNYAFSLFSVAKNYYLTALKYPNEYNKNIRGHAANKLGVILIYEANFFSNNTKERFEQAFSCFFEAYSTYKNQDAFANLDTMCDYAKAYNLWDKRHDLHIQALIADQEKEQPFISYQKTNPVKKQVSFTIVSPFSDITKKPEEQVTDTDIKNLIGSLATLIIESDKEELLKAKHEEKSIADPLQQQTSFAKTLNSLEVMEESNTIIPEAADKKLSVLKQAEQKVALQDPLTETKAAQTDANSLRRWWQKDKEQPKPKPEFEFNKDDFPSLGGNSKSKR
jgi:hypothetical protein